MRCPRWPVTILGLILAMPPGAAGAEIAGERTLAPVALAVGGAWFDSDRRNDEAAETRLVLRRAAGASGLRPFATASATSDGSVFAGAGLGYDVTVGETSWW